MNPFANDATLMKEQVKSNGGFDPLQDLLVAQRDKPSQMAPLNLRALSPYQRALLVIDGTVTKFIEAYTMEPVQVVLIDQDERELTEDHVWLDLPKGARVIARQVLLQGKYDRTLYAYAASLLVYDRLPEAVRADLKLHPGGLGRILLKQQLETRREILWYGREHLDNLPEPVCHMAEGRFISRTYRIQYQGKPFMLINEKFPFEVDPAFSHH